MEDRLGLVVARVADRDDGGPSPLRDLREPGIAGLAGVGLGGVGGAIGAPVAEVERQSQRTGQIGHEPGVGLGCLAPGPVVEVGDR